MVVLIALLLGVLGCVLVVLGLVGRYVGDRSHCRACRFELTGLIDESATGDSRSERVCPECGNRLDTPRAVTIGRKEKRRLIVGCGMLVCLVAFAFGTLAISASNTSLNSKKPTWLLMIEATRLSGMPRDAAAKELLVRHLKKPLTHDQLAALVEPGLAYQLATQENAWLTSDWAELMDAAFVANGVSSDQITRYATNAFAAMDTKIPSAMLASQSWPRGMRVTYDLMPDRAVPVVPAQPLRYTAPLIAASLDGEPLPLKPRSSKSDTGKPEWFGVSEGYLLTGTTGSYISSGTTSSCVIHDTESYDILPWHTTPGTHTIKLTYAVNVYLGAKPPRRQPPTPQTPVASWTHVVEHPFETFDNDEDIATLVGQEEYPDFHPVCTVGGWSSSSILMDHSIDIGIGQATYRASMSINLKTPWYETDNPLLASHVEFRKGDQRWVPYGDWKQVDGHYGSVFITLGYEDGSFHQGVGIVAILPDDFPHLGSVDVVLVPDIHEAARRGYTRKIWNQEVLVKDVPIDWSAIDQPLDDGE